MKNKLQKFGLAEKFADNDPNASLYIPKHITIKKRGSYEHGDK